MVRLLASMLIALAAAVPAAAAEAFDPALAEHVLERLTYGATEGDRARIREMGIDGFIRYQLDPARIPESPALISRQAALPPAVTEAGDPSWLWPSLWADYPLRARYGARQLNEVMTDFWLNHFDVALDYGNDAGVAGLFSSLAIDPAGRPVIAFVWNGNVFCARFDGKDWVKEHVDPGIPPGWFPSLAIDPGTGQPAVSFHEPDWPGRGRGDLRFARFDGSAWHAEAVDREGDVGAWDALAFRSDGVPLIAYQDRTRRSLRLARHSDLGWEVFTVAADTHGFFTALALDAEDRPAIAWYDLGRGEVRFAAFDGASFRESVVARVPAAALDWTAEPAPPPLLALGIAPRDRRPLVAYYEPANRSLRAAVLAEDGSWRTETVASGGDVGLYPSIAFDPRTGEPVIGHYDRVGHHLRVARFDGQTWTSEAVDTGRRITGPWSRIAFDPEGRLHASTFNGSTFALEHATDAAGSWRMETVVTQGAVLRTHVAWMREYVDGMRANALGCFRELLQASAESAAMMTFLNNDLNVAGLGNENYARELMELHTLGVDGGYTQADVETVARALTGWSTTRVARRCDIERLGFCYDHGAHDPSPKVVLGVALAGDRDDRPESWMRQGREILDRLSRHPSTARFVCGKLVQKLVADVPPPRLWDACAASFAASDGDIREVLATLLSSPEFRDPRSFGAKVRTPIEYTVAAVRHLEGDTDGISLYPRIEDQGMAVFFNVVPTGWSETAPYWLSGNSFLNRWRFADWLAHAGDGTRVDPAALVAGRGLVRADQAVDFVVARVAGGRATERQRRALLDTLGGDPGAVDWSRPEVEARLREVVEMALGFPGAHRQ